MRLLIAGGGTGGHLFPGVALAQEVERRGTPRDHVLFVGTERGIEARILPQLGWPHEFINMSGLKTVGFRGALRGALRVPRAMGQSAAIIKRFAPNVVVGVGGYASFPVVFMARAMGIPSAILEQNSVPGLANRVLGKVVRAAFLSFAESKTYFSPSKVIMSGNPIRSDILQPTSERPTSSMPRLFVFGGSQGAVAVNRLVVGALEHLRERGLQVQVVHQTGKSDLTATRERYQAVGIEADCSAFIQDMAEEYARCDLVLARAGATTVAELTIVGKPALLIPYPYAADNHQETNAKELTEAGAAQMFRQEGLTEEQLANALYTLLSDRDLLARMGTAMKTLGRPHAAQEIIDWCEQQKESGE